MKETDQPRIMKSLDLLKFASRDTLITDGLTGLTARPSREDNGDTCLTGPVVDQAALHGLLRKVRDLGLPIPFRSFVIATHLK